MNDVGENNIIATIISSTSRWIINPLYLYGTHLELAQGVQDVVEWFLSDVCDKIVRVNANDFSSVLLRGIAEGQYSEVRDSFRTGTALIFEDIEQLGRRETAQMEFYSLFDHYYEQGKQIIITSSVPPCELHSLHDRVRTQVEGGMIFSTDALRNEIMPLTKAEKQDVSLDDFGPLTDPMPEDAPTYDFARIREYCKKYNKSLLDMTEEEIESFRSN